MTARGAGRLCASLGLGCAGLVAVQLASHQTTPPGVPESAISTAWGGYLCLGAAATMLILLGDETRVARIGVLAALGALTGELVATAPAEMPGAVSSTETE